MRNEASASISKAWSTPAPMLSFIHVGARKSLIRLRRRPARASIAAQRRRAGIFPDILELTFGLHDRCRRCRCRRDGVNRQRVGAGDRGHRGRPRPFAPYKYRWRYAAAAADAAAFAAARWCCRRSEKGRGARVRVCDGPLQRLRRTRRGGRTGGKGASFAGELAVLSLVLSMSSSSGRGLVRSYHVVLFWF